MRKSKKAKPVQIHELKITLCGSKPPIWRQIAISSDTRLNELHEVIQIVIGWTNSHLHQFIVSNRSRKEYRSLGKSGWTHLERRLSDPRFELEDTENENEVMLGDLAPAVKSKFIYEYDFGDSWEHLIEVVKIGLPIEGVKYPVCLAGKLACPSEDCGGLEGYYNMLEALKDPKCEDYKDMLAWVGKDFNPEQFDVDEINAILAKEIR